MKLNRVHAQFPRAFQIQSAIVDQDALRRFALRDFQRSLINSGVRLAHAQITRAEKRLEIIAQIEFRECGIR